MQKRKNSSSSSSSSSNRRNPSNYGSDKNESEESKTHKKTNSKWLSTLKQLFGRLLQVYLIDLNIGYKILKK